MPPKRRKRQEKPKLKPAPKPKPESQANPQVLQSREVIYAVRIGITPTGKQRTDAEVKAEVVEALEGARAQLSGDESVGAHVEEEGGYLGLGAEWHWLFVTLAPLAPLAGYVAKGFVEGAAKKMGEGVGQKLLDLFFKELRARHLSPGAPKPAPDITSVVLPAQVPQAKSRERTTHKGKRPSSRQR